MLFSGELWHTLYSPFRIINFSPSQGRSQEFDWGGVYVLTSHCNFKTYVNVPHVNKTVTDFGGIVCLFVCLGFNSTFSTNRLYRTITVG